MFSSVRVCERVFKCLQRHAWQTMYHKWNSIVDVVHNSFTSQIIAFYELRKFEIFDSMTSSHQNLFE